jgi:hypothetical protein
MELDKVLEQLGYNWKKNSPGMVTCLFLFYI